MEALKSVNLLRRMCHDFGNHLQVISGYTDLGRGEAVKNYISELTKEMAEKRLLFNLDSPEACLFLYEQTLLAKDAGAVLRYQELEISSGQRLRLKNEPLNTVKTLLNEHKVKEEITIEVSIFESPLETKMLIFCPVFSEKILTFYLKE